MIVVKLILIVYALIVELLYLHWVSLTINAQCVQKTQIDLNLYTCFPWLNNLRKEQVYSNVYHSSMKVKHLPSTLEQSL